MSARNYVMSRLNDRDRIILILSMNSISDKQISEALNTSPESIKVSRLKALKKLTGELMEDECFKISR
jgi:DNA-binding CsgD family transcriptional regulator